jgi:hypothetical protein
MTGAHHLQRIVNRFIQLPEGHECELRRKITAVEAAHIYHKFRDKWAPLNITQMLCVNKEVTLIRELFFNGTFQNEHMRIKRQIERGYYTPRPETSYSIVLAHEDVGTIPQPRPRYTSIRTKYRYSMPVGELFNVELTFVNNEAAIDSGFNPYSVLKPEVAPRFSYEIEIEFKAHKLDMNELKKILDELYNVF